MTAPFSANIGCPGRQRRNLKCTEPAVAFIELRIAMKAHSIAAERPTHSESCVKPKFKVAVFRRLRQRATKFVLWFDRHALR